MSASRGLKAWRGVHTWSSLICTGFMLVLCLTGLPLIFHDEISDALNHPPAFPAVAPGTPPVGVDRMVEQAMRAYPGDVVRSVAFDDDAPQVFVLLAANRDGPERHPHSLTFDSRTGSLRRDQLKGAPLSGLMGFLLQLHGFLLLGLPGRLFLSLMGSAFVAALVSGAVLYAPFARRLGFGEVRTRGSRRLAWLDLHNLVGAVALVWMGVVGVTGVMNTLSTPLFGIWEMTDVAHDLRPYAKLSAVIPTAGLQSATQRATAAVPGQQVAFVTYPAHFQSSPAHYVVWLKGARTLTSRLMTPVLVDARTGRVAEVVRMPWYLRVLEVSRPLHFGDYGGPLLKVLWALLDLLTIGMLVSGLYLWVAKRRPGRDPAGAIDLTRAVEA